MAETYWRDVDSSFNQNGVGSLLVKTNGNSLKQRLRNLLRTEVGDIPFHPEIACGLRELLFDNYTLDVKSTVIDRITTVIETQEPNVTITSMDVEFDESSHELYIVGSCRVDFTDEIVEFKSLVGRVR